MVQPQDAGRDDVGARAMSGARAMHPPSLPRLGGIQPIENTQSRERGREGGTFTDPIHARARIDLSTNASLPPSVPTDRDINGLQAAKPREGGRHSPEQSTSCQVDRLADAVRRLSPSHRDPERFHVDKHSIAAELHDLARRLRLGR